MAKAAATLSFSSHSQEVFVGLEFECCHGHRFLCGLKGGASGRAGGGSRLSDLLSERVPLCQAVQGRSVCCLRPIDANVRTPPSHAKEEEEEGVPHLYLNPTVLFDDAISGGKSAKAAKRR